MPRFRVRKIYKYSEEVEVEADDRGSAKDAAMHVEGDVMHDDFLYDCEIIEEIKQEPKPKRAKKQQGTNHV